MLPLPVVPAVAKCADLKQNKRPSIIGGWDVRNWHQSYNPFRALHSQIVAHPKDTIVFDQERHDKIQAIVRRIGSDGRLVLDGSGKVLLCRT